MSTDQIRIHTSRRCANCAHREPEHDNGCLQMVGMADGSQRPAWFACPEHQTDGEYRLELHRPSWRVLGIA